MRGANIVFGRDNGGILTDGLGPAARAFGDQNMNSIIMVIW